MIPVRKFKRRFAVCTAAVAALLAIGCGPSNIDRTITQGEYDGFVIGSTGEQVYNRIQAKYRDGELRRIGDIPFINGFDSWRSLSEAEGLYDKWKRWFVDWDDIGLNIYFEGDTIDRFDGGRTAWPPMEHGFDDTVFTLGMSYDTAFARIEAVTSSGQLGAVRLGLFEKDLEKPYDPAWLDTSRFYSLEDGLIGWVLFLPGDYSDNSLRLYFRGESLVKIRRLRLKHFFSL